MPSLWEILKTSKGLPAPDGFTALFARSLSDTYTLAEISGIPPLNLGEIVEIVDYTIYGNTYQSDGVSPDTPQEVVGVGERTGNLINIIPFKTTFGTGSAVIRDFLNSLDVGAYVISYNIELLTRNDSTDNSIYGIRVINESGSFDLIPKWGSASTGTVKKISLKITITEDNKGKFTNVYFYGCGIFSVGVTGSAQIYDFMLNSGSTPLPYEPYGYKVDVVSRGKNLFDKDWLVDGYHLSPETGLPIENARRTAILQPINVTQIDKMVMTYTTIDNDSIRGIYSVIANDGTLVRRVTNISSNNGIDVSGGDKFYIAFYDSSSSANTVSKDNIENIMLNAGTTPEPYEPYVEPITTPIYLDSPLYKIGDYSDSRGMTEEVRAINELVLAGEENWGNNYNGYTLSTAKKQGLYTVICSHYAPSAAIKEDKTVYTNSTNVLIFYDSSFTTVEAWKSYLAEQYNNGTPVKVYYILAEPEIKTVSPVEIPTIQSTNIVDINTEVKPSNLKITYKSKM